MVFFYKSSTNSAALNGGVALLLPPMISAPNDALDFSALSISFQKAEIAVRSQFSLGFPEQQQLLKDIISQGGKNALILSTCNRTEIYCSGMSLDKMRSLFLLHTSASSKVFDEVVLKHVGMDAVRHLFNVGCALNSQIVGDTEISGQLKRSLLHSKSSNVDNAWLERLVSCVLRASKRVKRETGLSFGATSVAFSAVQFMREAYTSLEGKKIVLFGLGKLGSNTCRNLSKHHSSSKIVVINRDDEKTRQIVAKFGFESAKISELKKELVDADVLIVATGAQGYTITADVINPRKELLILDMSMPRNADPKLVELSQVRLVHIDELSKAANIRLGDRFNHIPKAEKIVLEEIEEFSAWLQSLEIAPTLGLVTKNLRVFRDIEMTKITSGDEEEEKRMLLLTDKVIQKVTTQVATFLKTKSERPGEDMSLFEEVFQRPSNHDA